MVVGLSPVAVTFRFQVSHFFLLYISFLFQLKHYPFFLIFPTSMPSILGFGITLYRDSKNVDENCLEKNKLHLDKKGNIFFAKNLFMDINK